MLQGQKLQQAFDDYIVNFSAEKGLQPNSIQNKKDVLNGLIPFLDGKPFTLESCRDFIAFKYAHGWVKPNSRRNLVKYLRAFINFLYDREYIEMNFAKKLVVPRVIRPPLQLISEDMAEKVILAGTEPIPFIFGKQGDNSRNVKIKAETRLCLLFMLRTGLRINEALSLKGTDLSPFDDQPSFLVISKGGNAARLPLPDDMVEEMKKRVNRDRVFRTTKSTCNDNLKVGMVKLGVTIPTTCHSLRHIFTLSRLRRGNPLQLVSRTLRHTSVNITDKYYSNYVISDIEPVVNDSPLIKRNLTPAQVVEKAIKAFTDVIENDPRLDVQIETNGIGEAKIAVKQRKIRT